MTANSHALSFSFDLVSIILYIKQSSTDYIESSDGRILATIAPKKVEPKPTLILKANKGKFISL